MTVSDDEKYVKILQLIKEKNLSKQSFNKSVSPKDRVLSIVTNRKGIMDHIPEELYTYDMCLTDVSVHKNVFRGVPSRFRTIELCTIAILKDQGLRVDFSTKESCLHFVESHPKLFDYIPPENQTPEACEIGTEIFFSNFIHVRPDLQTQTMFDRCIDADERLLKYGRPDLQTVSVCIRAVAKKNAYVFRFVRPDIQTLEMCMEAVTRDQPVIKRDDSTNTSVILSNFERVRPDLVTRELEAAHIEAQKRNPPRYV